MAEVKMLMSKAPIDLLLIECCICFLTYMDIILRVNLSQENTEAIVDNLKRVMEASK